MISRNIVYLPKKATRMILSKLMYSWIFRIKLNFTWKVQNTSLYKSCFVTTLILKKIVYLNCLKVRYIVGVYII